MRKDSDLALKANELSSCSDSEGTSVAEERRKTEEAEGITATDTQRNYVDIHSSRQESGAEACPGSRDEIIDAGHGSAIDEGAGVEEAHRGDNDEIDGEGHRVPALPITLELLSKGGYYDMPMSKVARLLGRTEGSFQRICRGLGILRWPYRVRKSLQAIMEKTEQYLDDGAQEDGMSKAEVLRVLQGHMDDIKGISGSGMDKATKQYRQYIFKVNHKLSRKAAKMGNTTYADSMKVRGMLKAASKIQNNTKKCSEHSRSKQATDTPNQRSTQLSQGHPRIAETPLGLQPLLTRQSGRDTAEKLSYRLAAPMEAGDGMPSGKPLQYGTSRRPIASQPTRPTPRYFRDLPASLAFEPLGREKACPSNIVGRMATSAAVQNRVLSGNPEDYRRLCMQEDEELLQLCLDMDSHLDAAQKALATSGRIHSPKAGCWPSIHNQYPALAGSPTGFGFQPLAYPPGAGPQIGQYGFWPQ